MRLLLGEMLHVCNLSWNGEEGSLQCDQSSVVRAFAFQALPDAHISDRQTAAATAAEN